MAEKEAIENGFEMKGLARCFCTLLCVWLGILSVTPAEASLRLILASTGASICATFQSRSPQKDDHLGTDQVVWVTDFRYPLLSCPEDGVSLQYPVAFGQRFYLAQNRLKPGWRLLLERAIKLGHSHPFTAVGWIEQRALFKSESPLLNPENQIPFKAMAVPKSNHQGEESISLSNAPRGGNRLPKQPFQHLTLYLYDAYPRPEDLSRRSLEQTQSLLVGRGPVLDAYSDENQSGLLGWIKTEWAILWDTRQALQFNEATPLYDTRQAAINHQKSAVIARVNHSGAAHSDSRSPIIHQADPIYHIIYSVNPKHSKQDRTISGWVNLSRPGGGRYDAEPVLLASYRDVIRLSMLLNNLQRVPVRTRTLQWRWTNLLAMFFDKRCDRERRLSDCFQAYGVLPVKSRFLEYSLDQLLDLSAENREQFLKLRCEIKMAAETLEGLLNEERLRFRVKDERFCSLTVIERTPLALWYKTAPGNELAWIPFACLP